MAVLLIASLAGCGDESSRLSGDEAISCARDRFKDQPGAFALTGNSITYSYESENGVGRVIVTFDERHRPVRTFFESTPYGTHKLLTDAAQAIKDCAEYGRRSARSERRRGPPRMIGV